MDVDGIGLVLARASELKSKISSCIQKSSTQINGITEEDDAQMGQEKTHFSGSNLVDNEAVDEDLCSIQDAFESLETQLSALQALQQQQHYERETTLAEIDYSRQKLLKKLKDYRGEDLEVLREATAFASETVEDNNDLLLPPYPSRPSRSLVSENGFLSRLPFASTYPQNGLTNGDPSNEMGASLQDSERHKVQSKSKSPFRLFINVATKTVLTLVSVAGFLSLAGFDPMLRKRDAPQFKVSGIFQRQGTEGKRPRVQCPPGKVLVVEAGEARCLVKERVEVPFKSVDMTPNVNYGCG
ncbi:Plastid division protein PDV2 [Heracleum sosnowskyi]|uniref:Plastid division protein PDV2 n=1 Tax=Heracleum sosnowskyi TaxID=360622 RepID=A0AAD8JHL6_9APIA|nr:Plastid division protein PDV2 [Heracleum sosnowskyi]